jgi:hypothetical protein
MDIRQRRTVQSFEHVLLYLDQHGPEDAPPVIGRMRLRLKDVIRRVSELSIRQNSAHNSTFTSKGQKIRRTALRRQMMALVRIAKPQLKFASGVEGALRVPHARSSTKQVAQAAADMANALAPHSALLEEAGYGPKFLDEFRAEAEAMEAAEGAWVRARNERGRLTVDVAAVLKEGMETVTVIEGALMKYFAGSPSMARFWKDRRRVPKRMGRPKRRKAT